MKTPISYWGGKQKMAKRIISMIPEHETFIEPFCGGSAVLFAKPISKKEVLNDLNPFVFAFWNQMATNFEQLQKFIQSILHSKSQFSEALNIYKGLIESSELEKAVAFWVLTNQSFSSNIGSSWSYAKTTVNKTGISLANKRENFHVYEGRLKNCTIERIDAIDCIKKYDNKEAFFYVDPPYFNADMGHYGGYKEKHFDNLLQCLSQIEGKFILSCYPNDLINKFDWTRIDLEMTLFSSKGSSGKKCRKKTETLLMNFEDEIQNIAA